MLRRVLLIALLGTPTWAASVAEVRQGFDRPPDDARIMMRWWWFGTAVTKPELEREMRQMKEGGIGGFEVQPVYPLALDDPEKGFRNLPYLSDDYLDALSFAAQKARELGLRIDITLGSGWPFGGPHIPVTEAAGKLRCDRVAISADAASIAVPSIGNGEQLMATFLAKGDTKQFAPDGIRQISAIQNGRLVLPKDLSGPHVVLFFISSRTGMQVKRPAVGAEGFVLDHYDQAAIESHLQYTGERLMKAFGATPPHSVFSDSLEVFASDWTPQMLDEFRKRRGYDLTPYLPALVGDIGDKTAAVRHDWGQTLTELCDERYLTPIREWAHKHGTLFRSQTYGTPPVVLSSNALVDLPEGEAGPRWRTFSTARWASSASHLYGRPVTSTETWTWLHSPAFRATPLDMKAEADLHFLQGINQLIGHGWAYSPESAGEPGWRFYAAAVFNAHNPWWIVMPDLTKYLQRVSYLMRQGKPANDIAVYLPTDDAWAQFTAGKDSVDRSMEAILGPELIPQILDAGYNFDFIDDRAIASVGVPYPVVIVPGAERMSATTLEKLRAYRDKGGIVVATRRLPSLAPGLIGAEKETPRVKELEKGLFHFVADEKTLGKELAALFTPDFASAAGIGFTHRKLDDGDIYFVANTTNHAVHTRASVRIKGLEPEWWNAFTAQPAAVVREGEQIALDLEPYESRVLIFSRSRSQAPALRQGGTPTEISSSWKVTFPSTTLQMDKLRSWTGDETTRYFSGQAIYENTFQAPPQSQALVLKFGEATPLEPEGSRNPGMRAWLDSPIREAAQVYVNGQLAGPVWLPPYEIDITRLSHPGANELRVVVANLAINEMAGQSQPDYKLLNLRFGERFQPQDMNNLQPLPSGLMGPVQLIVK
jgi:hypothetical protein